MTTLKEVVLYHFTDGSCCLTDNEEHRELGIRSLETANEDPRPAADKAAQLYVDDLQKLRPGDGAAMVLMMESAQIIEYTSNDLTWKLLEEYARHGNDGYVHVIAEVSICEASDNEINEFIDTYVSGSEHKPELEEIALNALQARGDELLLGRAKRAFSNLH